LPAPLASGTGFGGTTGSAGFFGHVSQLSSAAAARVTDPMLMARKQTAQKIATTDLPVDR
jgi:hypothetical protein